jgi:hypothetical protein
MFYCTRHWWLKSRVINQPQEQAMRNPQPFVVIQNAKPLFTVHAYSLEQARGPSSRQRSRAKPSLSPSRKAEPADDSRHQERPTRNGMCLSDAKGDQARHGARSDGVRRRTHAQRQSLPLDGLQSARSHLPRRPRHAGSAMGGAVRRDGARTIQRALHQQDRRSPADGGQRDPHDVPVAEVARGLSLRCGHRLAVAA